VCAVIYLNILKEFMNFMVSVMHLTTVMFQNFYGEARMVSYIGIFMLLLLFRDCV
jgi:hypothetical protein